MAELEDERFFRDLRNRSAELIQANPDHLAHLLEVIETRMPPLFMNGLVGATVLTKTNKNGLVAIVVLENDEMMQPPLIDLFSLFAQTLGSIIGASQVGIAYREHFWVGCQFGNVWLLMSERESNELANNE
jgi:hypothetical protein